MNEGRALEISVISALVLAFEKTDAEVPTREEVARRAKYMAGAYQFKAPLEPVVDMVLTRITTRMPKGRSLIDTASNHDREWAGSLSEKKLNYTLAYEKHLSDRGWTSHMIGSLRSSGVEILGLLNDPSVRGRWDRRGLVVGHVQSGKTASYIELATLAADAGYRVIIIVSGIQNELRSQTQERVDEGFIGYSQRDGQRKDVGVGLKRKQDQFPVTLTTIDSDFNYATAKAAGIPIRSLLNPIVLVIKKNVSVLENLRDWFESLNAQTGSLIEGVPLLFVDDEADHASVNTKKPEHDPTRTNRLIRDILRLFGQSSFVGYTATPFANIFIDPDSYDAEVREDLFPKHFIHALRAPSTYFGPDRIFPSDGSSSPWIRDISDCGDVLPLNHKKDYEIPVLPGSLAEALNLCIVSRAIRIARGYEDHHHSMMINVSRFKAVQAQVHQLVQDRMDQLHQAIQANYALDDRDAQQDAIMRDLQAVFITNYSECRVEWSQVKLNLQSAAKQLTVLLINSDSSDVMDFTDANLNGRTVIAVGGFSLSRGLTLEGLCISYLYRSTRTYDTLMQMGRWFGYRSGFEDLCRIYLPQDTQDWYYHISDASEELVRQLERMNSMHKSPKDFGLYIRAHPGNLAITSPGKIRGGKKIRQTYAGLVRRCTLFPDDEEIHGRNENLIREFWERPVDGNIEETEKGWIIRRVGLQTIDRFLERFEVHNQLDIHKTLTRQYLAQIERIHPRGEVLLISPKGRDGDRKPLRLGYQERSLLREESGWSARKGTIASRGDEKLGLSVQQQERARKAARRVGRTPIDSDYRAERRKPLLIVHIVKNTNRRGRGQRIPSFDVSFPNDYSESIEVVANQVMQAQQLELPFNNYSEVEEDE